MVRLFILIALVTTFVPTFSIVASAQIIAKSDTAIVLSISVIDVQARCQRDFPEVYPNIDNINLLVDEDTVKCVYNFPFIIVPKSKFAKVLDKRVFMSFNYNLSNKSVSSRYLLIVPLMFYLKYNTAKFIVVKYYGKDIFFATQSWGSIVTTLEKITTKKYTENL